jgi:hypothetical protein
LYRRKQAYNGAVHTGPHLQHGKQGCMSMQLVAGVQGRVKPGAQFALPALKPTSSWSALQGSKDSEGSLHVNTKEMYAASAIPATFP